MAKDSLDACSPSWFSDFISPNRSADSTKGSPEVVAVLRPMADPEQGRIDDVVDVDRYPLTEPGSNRWRDLVADVRQSLDRDGAVTLQQFLRPEAVSAIATQLAQAADHVPIMHHAGTVYARSDLEAELAAEDPRRVEQTWHAGHVTRDMIPAYADSHRLYVSPMFKSFVAACVGTERVYEYADPIAGLVATVLPSGGRYPWHYDTNEFVVTVMIRKPEAGGSFEYVQDLRRPGYENLDGLASVLAGNESASTRSTDNDPGDLQLFRGRYSLHRVTPVEGPEARHVLVLSYADQPGVIGPVDRTRNVYGRVTEAHLLAAEGREGGHDGLIL